MPPKKASATEAATLQPLDPNQETLSLREAQSQKRKATSRTPQEDELDQEIRNMEMLHQQVQRKNEKMARLADLQRQIDEATEELKLNKNEGPNTGSSIKKACSAMMDGMMISIMVPLLLTMLLPWQRNCRLSNGHHHISHLSSQCMMGIQIRSSF
jgi:type I site-specific restriction endonuclease